MMPLAALLKLGAAVGALGLLAWSHHAVYQHGRMVEQAAFLHRINEENRDAGTTAEEWRARYRRCLERGGLYDFERGACHD